MSSADFTIYTPGIGTLSLIRSHLLWGEFSAFSAANVIQIFFSDFSFHQVPITAGWALGKGSIE